MIRPPFWFIVGVFCASLAVLGAQSLGVRGVWSSSAGNTYTNDFDQDLNTTDSPTFTNLTVKTAGAVRTDTTTAHTAKIQAYDVDGTAYKDFITLTNGNTPDLTIAPPSGGSITLQGVLKANDGTSGLTQTCAAAVTAVTVKNGLITAITCP